MEQSIIEPSSTKKEQENKKREKNLKELYSRYTQCRDAELDRFWKNSVFVWVFLALCFTAFGTLVKAKNMSGKNGETLTSDDYYLFLTIISSIGLLLSFIWVWMARGLKAWYEVYENAIWEIESYKNEFNYPHQYTIDNYWGIKESKCFIQRCFFAPRPISPSKIVILIGLLLISIWCLAFGYSLFYYYSTKSYQCNCNCIHLPSYCPIIIIVIVIILLIIIRIWFLQSSSIRNKNCDNIYKKIRKDIECRAFTESAVSQKNEDCYNLYFEVKKDKVTFYFRNKNGFEIGRKLIIDYYKSVPIETNTIDYSVTFNFNTIDDFYYKRCQSTISKNDVKSLFENMNINNVNIEIDGHNLVIHFPKEYYKLHTYMIASCIDVLIQKYESQFTNYKVVIN